MKPAFDPLAQRYASAPADTQEGPAVAAKEDAKNPADLLTCRALHVPKMGLEPIRF